MDGIQNSSFSKKIDKNSKTEVQRLLAFTFILRFRKGSQFKSRLSVFEGVALVFIGCGPRSLAGGRSDDGGLARLRREDAKLIHRFGVTFYAIEFVSVSPVNLGDRQFLDALHILRVQDVRCCICVA